VLAGHPDNPRWWRAPLVLLVVGVALLVAGVLVGGAVATALISIACVVWVPVAFQGLWMVAISAIADRDDADPAQRRAAQRVLLAGRTVSLIAAAGGVLLYVVTPGDGSYQLSSLLVWPLFTILLRRVDRRIQTPPKWAAAIVLAGAGCAGYVVFGGPQWWNWGQFAVYPLAMLLIARSVRSGSIAPRDRWLGGYRDGPWGPP
jgi:hypothetical protein